MENDKALQPYQGAVAPMPLDEVEKLGKYLAASKYFTDVADVSQAVVKIIAGQALGFDPVYSMSKLYIIKGRVTVMAEAVAAMIKRTNRYDYKVLMHDDNLCRMEFSDGEKPVYVSEFTMAQAKRAHLVKPGGAWESWPRAMLFSKALLQGARIVCPHIIAGVRTVEEYGQAPDQPFDVKQAEEDIETLWQDDVAEIGEVEPAIEPTPEVLSPVTAPEEPETSSDAPTEPIIDLVWLKQSLEALNWSDVGKYLQKYGVAGTRVKEMVENLNPEQTAEFKAEVQSRLDML